jgi:hypothetical protein
MSWRLTASGVGTSLEPSPTNRERSASAFPALGLGFAHRYSGAGRLQRSSASHPPSLHQALTMCGSCVDVSLCFQQPISAHCGLEERGCVALDRSWKVPIRSTDLRCCGCAVVNHLWIVVCASSTVKLVSIDLQCAGYWGGELCNVPAEV